MDLHLHQRRMAVFLLIVFMFGQWSCTRWQRHVLDERSLPRLVAKPRAVFLVTEGTKTAEAWRIRKPVLTQDTLSGSFERLPDLDAMDLLNADRHRDLKYHARRVILYADDGYQRDGGAGPSGAIALSRITRMEYIDVDAGATIGLSLLGLVGITALLLLIIIATKSSCPFVFSQDANGAFHLEGEVFSGAIYPQLQRHDRLPLRHLRPMDGHYRVRLSNLAREIQHTDLVRLIAVDHTPGVQILFDRHGSPHALAAPAAPMMARAHNGTDLTGTLAKMDGVAWHGDPDNATQDARETIELRFNRPTDAPMARLMVTAKNTFWLDHLFGLFLDEMGTYADRVRQRDLGRGAEELHAWAKAQRMPLSVHVLQRSGAWKEAGQFELMGPIAWRDDVLQIDLGDAPADEVVIRLSTGYLFWEIDRVALDMGTTQALMHSSLVPVKATDQDGRDVLSVLMEEDGIHLIQPDLDDMTEIVFQATPAPEGAQRSLFLHAAGHYEILRDPLPHRPSLLYLRTFEDADALPRYSRERYEDSRAYPLKVAL